MDSKKIIRAICVFFAVLFIGMIGIRSFTSFMIEHDPEITINVDKCLQKDNFERRGNYIVEHLEADADILGKKRTEDKNHIPFDAYIRKDWQEEQKKTGDYSYYEVSARIYTEEVPSGYLDQTQEVSKEVYDKITSNDRYRMYRTVYYDQKGIRLAVVDDYEPINTRK